MEQLGGKNTKTTTIGTSGTRDIFSASKVDNFSSGEHSKASSKTRTSTDKTLLSITQVVIFDEDSASTSQPQDENKKDKIPFYKKCPYKYRKSPRKTQVGPVNVDRASTSRVNKKEQVPFYKTCPFKFTRKVLEDERSEDETTMDQLPFYKQCLQKFKCKVLEDECSQDELDTIAKLPFYKKFLLKFTCKVIVFLVLGILNVADLVPDWLVYRDVTTTETGLVHGPVHPAIQSSLLAFSVVGSLAFTFEVVNLWFEVFRDSRWIDSDLMSAIAIWTGDVPQIGIHVAIVACREEVISYFQLVKASVIIMSVLIRIMESLFKKVLRELKRTIKEKIKEETNKKKKKKKKKKTPMRRVIYRAFIVAGLVLTLGGAISVFLFTQSERNPNGTINVKAPNSVIDGERDDQKYFQNVSIFLSNSLFDLNIPPISEKDIVLIRLVHINKVRKKDYNIGVRIVYKNTTANHREFTITQTDTATTNKKQDCFNVNLLSGDIALGSSCDTYITGQSSELIFVFHFVKAKVPGLIFGDITYNVKTKKTGANCVDTSFTMVDDIAKRITDRGVAAMHYFRTDKVATEHPIVHLPSNKGRYYHVTDLIDVKDLWRTGYASCRNSGRVAPHVDHSIDLVC